MKTSLPITENIPTSSYFCISLPLGVILATPETIAWYYENFINIYIEEKGNICFTDICFGMLAKYNSVFEYSISTQKDTEGCSIVDRVKHELRENQNYAYMYVDEYYISRKKAYGKYHFHHHVLVYGYNDEEKCFEVLAFDETEHFKKMKYPYNEIEKGYTEAFGCDNEDKNETFGAIFFKIRKNFEHHLFLPNVITALQEYVNGTIPKNLRFLQHNMAQVEFHQGQDSIYGINVLRETSKLLDEIDLLNMDFPYFRRVHFLYEHAKMLLERIRYYYQYADYDDGFYISALSEYEKIVEQYQKARLLFMKMEMIQEQRKNIAPSALRIIQSLKAIYVEIYQKEKVVLAQILRCMRDWKMIVAVGKHESSYELTAKLFAHTEKKDSKKIYIFSFDKRRPVNLLSFYGCEDMQIYVDGILYDSYSFTGMPVAGIVEIPLNRWIQEISFHFSSESTIDVKDIRMRIFGGNVFLEAQAVASTVWADDDGHASKSIHCAQKAVIGNERVYWRAAVQKYSYDGTDWISLELKEKSTINCIVLNELSYSKRLKNYTIYFTDENGHEQNLLTYNTDGSCRYHHQFPPITLKKLKIVFESCFQDALNYCEPIVSSVQGYYLPMVETLAKTQQLHCRMNQSFSE